ncbi:hypothetical protein [Rufibacter sp. LB8]|uniref:hypothetical protein n=1 Tax=Rufibacter sp. LB8 TaxID=2777781 RepID=UPI00178C25A4|nr:hypothetical protein [Rufibacter sp. LB8]
MFPYFWFTRYRKNDANFAFWGLFSEMSPKTAGAWLFKITDGKNILPNPLFLQRSTLPLAQDYDQRKHL